MSEITIQQGPFRADVGVAAPVRVPGLVPRRQVRRLVALGTAVGAHVRRLVRAQHVPRRHRPVPPSLARVRPPLQERLEGRGPTVEGREVRSRGPDAVVRRCRGQVFCAQAVHHDNFDNWDSSPQPLERGQMGPKKDIVGLWQAAAQKLAALWRDRAPRRDLCLVVAQQELRQARPLCRRAL